MIGNSNLVLLCWSSSRADCDKNVISLLALLCQRIKVFEYIEISVYIESVVVKISLLQYFHMILFLSLSMKSYGVSTSAVLSAVVN